MPRYQANDEVRMIHPMEDVIVPARVIRVQYEADEADEDDRDLYELEYIGDDEDFEDDIYGEVEEHEIVELLAGPTHDRRTQEEQNNPRAERPVGTGIWQQMT